MMYVLTEQTRSASKETGTERMISVASGSGGIQTVCLFGRSLECGFVLDQAMARATIK
jgi:hypothetical protein